MMAGLGGAFLTAYVVIVVTSLTMSRGGGSSPYGPVGLLFEAARAMFSLAPTIVVLGVIAGLFLDVCLSRRRLDQALPIVFQSVLLTAVVLSSMNPLAGLLGSWAALVISSIVCANLSSTRRPSTDDFARVNGLEFTHPETGEVYGGIRVEGEIYELPNQRDHRVFADDASGNHFVVSPESRVLFLDHETEEFVSLAESWDGFVAGCGEPRDVAPLPPHQVLSVWIDPEFAKEQGIDAPPDGWIKKPPP